MRFPFLPLLTPFLVVHTLFLSLPLSLVCTGSGLDRLDWSQNVPVPGVVG